MTQTYNLMRWRIGEPSHHHHSCMSTSRTASAFLWQQYHYHLSIWRRDDLGLQTRYFIDRSLSAILGQEHAVVSCTLLLRQMYSNHVQIRWVKGT